jgi:hypothetical protein
MMKKVLSKFYIFQVTVPQLLMWHKHDFSHQLVEVFGPEYEGIIHIIADHMTGQQQTSIQELLQLDRVYAKSGENIGMVRF